MKRFPRRIFAAEFKREAIKLVTEQGLTLVEASRKLDVATKSLRTCRMSVMDRWYDCPVLAPSSIPCWFYDLPKAADQQALLSNVKHLQLHVP
jgi:hypothetical protein